MKRQDQFLLGKKIAISISESPDLAKNGFGFDHLKHCMVEFAQQLMKAGAILVYGGDLAYDKRFNFLDVLHQLAQLYSIPQLESRPIINYAAYPFHLNYDLDIEADITDYVKVLKLPKQHDIRLTDEDLIKVENLTAMRTQMAIETDARIVLGGSLGRRNRKYAGVYEEAFLTMKFRRPLYAIGCFGGASEVVIHDLKEGLFTLPEHKDFFGISHLNNRLNDKENGLLFKSEDVRTLVRIVLSGLRRSLGDE